jgi:hypothetical protein
MRPFWRWFGGNWRSAVNYGAPRHQHVIEPFAGAAGYSSYWEPQQVTLLDLDPVVIGVWRYLQRSSGREIMRLPVDIEALDELPPRLCQEARDLIGLWFNCGLARPSKRRSNWARHADENPRFWGQEIRRRIASQVGLIRHWKIIHGSWEQAPNVAGHWFVDPPYLATGQAYVHNDIDRAALGEWCKRLRGHVTVCEAQGADWLPFEPLNFARTPRGHSAEAIFEIEAETVRRAAASIQRVQAMTSTVR